MKKMLLAAVLGLSTLAFLPIAVADDYGAKPQFDACELEPGAFEATPEEAMTGYRLIPAPAEIRHHGRPLHPAAATATPWHGVTPALPTLRSRSY